jgi:hypothetical protein
MESNEWKQKRLRMPIVPLKRMWRIAIRGDVMEQAKTFSCSTYEHMLNVVKRDVGGKVNHEVWSRTPRSVRRMLAPLYGFWTNALAPAM